MEPKTSFLQQPTVESAKIRERVDAALSAFLTVKQQQLTAISAELTPALAELAEFMAGGKRLRPTFAYWGYRAANDMARPNNNTADDESMIRAISALEWLHACALIHDDVMDSSDVRRGRASMHRFFSAFHRNAGWQGNAEAYGTATAILLGDICLIWSDEMLNTSGVSSAELIPARTIFDQMRTELMAGQYLDIASHAVDSTDANRIAQVMRYKSAKYTVERPLHFGAALGGGSAELIAALSNYGLPLGEAFQLRDDVLGVFGDPQQTGKPAGDDLRDGKRTMLIAHTLEQTQPDKARLLRQYLGDPSLKSEHIEFVQQLIIETGALANVEKRIAQLPQAAVNALDNMPITEETAAALHALAVATTSRTT